MWNVLKQFATEPESACTETDVAAVPCRSRRADRESISKSLSAAVLNAVTDGDYTDADRHIAMLKDGNGYVEANLDTHGMCFFIRLSHHEGEFAVGLGRRTFDAALDNPSEKLYEIEWYERKSKNRQSWGQQPAFKLSIGGYSKKRKPYPLTSIEQLTSFVPVAVELTPKSSDNAPVLTKACTAALRSFIAGEAGEAGEEVQNEDSDTEGVVVKAKRRRIAVIEDEDDD